MYFSAFSALQQFLLGQLLEQCGLTSTIPLHGRLHCPGQTHHAAFGQLLDLHSIFCHIHLHSS